MSEDLGSLADVAGANSVAAMAFGDVTASNEILAALALKPGVNAAALYAKDGVLFTSFQRSKASGEWIPSHVPTPVTAGNRTTVVRPIMFAGEIAGFIFRLERKFPGTSDITRNDRKVIPTSNGIILKIRLTRKRAIYSLLSISLE